VVVNGSFGAGNYGMCGRAFDPRFMFMWPQAQLALMGAEQAARTLSEVKLRQMERQGETPSAAEIAAIEGEVAAGFERQAGAYYCTSELWDDGLLDPVDTRNALAIAISCSLNAPIGEPRYGVLRL
jgi:3-methylcrotonyl-CoA carboxylase beta subunit